MTKKLKPRKMYLVLPEAALDCRVTRGCRDVYFSREMDRARRHKDLCNSERERDSDPMFLMFAVDIANLEHVTD